MVLAGKHQNLDVDAMLAEVDGLADPAILPAAFRKDSSVKALASMCWVILRNMIKIAREGRIDTSADFIGYRCGKPLLLAALVAVLAVIAIGPYGGRCFVWD